MSKPAAQTVRVAAMPLSATRGVLQRQCGCGNHTVSGGQCTECAKDKGALQRKAGYQGEPIDVPPIVHEVLNSAGRSLDAETRAFMEPRFGHDFSQVRVHTDTAAAESAKAVNALAYTVGRDIVFATGRYAPGTRRGRELLAHELTHTIQQSSDSVGSPLSLANPDSAFETEAHDVAATVTSTPASFPSVPVPEVRAGNRSVGRQLQRQMPGEAKKAGASCDNLCLTLGSLRRAVDVICKLAGEGDAKCKTNRATVAQDEKLVADAGCKCLKSGKAVDLISSCSTRYAKAATFQQLIDLVRAAEVKLRAAGIATTKDQIHALRGIYYGTTWSTDFADQPSTIRSEGFQRFTRPSEAPNKSVPPNVRAMLDCGLFEALQASQDMVDGARQVDFGHLIIGLDARGDPKLASNIQYPVLGGLKNIDMGGTGTEIVTWLGDLGGGTASVAMARVATPSQSVSMIFIGPPAKLGSPLYSDYGASINLEGDIAGSVIATSSSTAVTAPVFAAGKGLADALQDYLSPGTPSPQWKGRAKTFLTMNGGTFDRSGALTNGTALVASFAPKIQVFACNYLASRVKDGKATYALAKAAASHVIPASQEVAEAFVDALTDSAKAGDKIEAKRFPSPKPAKDGACASQLAAAGLLNMSGFGGPDK